MTENETVLYCATHPSVATALRCSKCEKLICPRCLIQTPVGARCRECAQLRRLPVFNLTPGLFSRALGAGLGAAAVTGFVWGLLPFGGLFGFVLAGVAGFGVGEAVSRGAGRRISTYLKLLAAYCFVMAYFVAMVVVPVMRMSLPAVFFTQVVAGAFLNPMGWLMLLLGAIIAVKRVE